MRLTILVNGSDPQARDDLAVLWPDIDERVWSRESHSGIDLPSWGRLRDEDDTMLLCGPEENAPLCTLHGSRFGRGVRAAIEHGAAAWVSTRSGEPVDDRWRLQAVNHEVEPAKPNELRH
ncbi:DUF3564 family protein (plasmid) [Mycetohabitans endofungorum]|uniref:DUF3564 family protein n=1 Tax=Mycetohabitans endofungorum TaxID=417203 RepID=UPI0030D06DD7